MKQNEAFEAATRLESGSSRHKTMYLADLIKASAGEYSGLLWLRDLIRGISGIIYLLVFIVILPMILFPYLAFTFRASGVKIVVFLLIIAPSLYLFLVGVYLFVIYALLLHKYKDKPNTGNIVVINMSKRMKSEGMLSRIRYLRYFPVALLFFVLALIFLPREKKLGAACFTISVLFLSGTRMFRDLVRPPGPDSDADED
ncbi:hypothetical protein KC19_2G215600 [Ceratodon purpureus]|uniref:Uncharacterized protein n=1 Tax=Ceratodon purpureus TaxID=3225 RepID=A0A8T0IZD6_CERPU|nr:hypothetical protein KC19_2G215600 [Ceratodon purpureus]